MTLANQLHENFARLIAGGQTCTDAYRTLKPLSRHPSALGSRLWGRVEVRVRVAELAEEASRQKILPISRKLELLEDQIRGVIPTKVIVRDKGKKEEVFDMLGAIDLHSKISGHYEHQRVANSGPTIKLEFNVLDRYEDETIMESVESPAIQKGSAQNFIQ